MSSRNRNQLPNNFPQLQNLIKRDPESYKDEFMQQYRHFDSQLQVFELNPSEYSKKLSDLITFLAQVSHCYPDVLVGLAETIRELLRRHTTILDPTMRMGMCKAMILLRNKGLIAATDVLELFFELFRCPDKLLRKTLYNYIVTDIKNVNSKRKDSKLNSTLQNFMYSMLRDSNAVAAKMSLDVMKDLYKRDVWNDTKTVNVITVACFSKVTKVLVASLNFFLGINKSDESDSESDGEEKTARQLQLAHRVGKKTKKRKRHLDRALQNLEKHKKKEKPVTYNFSAIHLVHDPQDFAERLLRQLTSTNERFEVKLMMINVISRLVGIHRLILANLYPYLQRYLQPHQREVTKLLLYTAQACHELVPPEIVESVIKTLTYNFITDRNNGEVIAVGLNAVREISVRCPLSMSEELITDLVQYKSYKNKPVMMAARSLIQLFRDTNHTILHKKYRGALTDVMAEHEDQQLFGDTGAKDYVPGAEILAIKSVKVPVSNEDDSWVDVSDDDDGGGHGNGNGDEAADTTRSDGNTVKEWRRMSTNESTDFERNQADLSVKIAVDERVELARDVTASRIFTQQDFEVIRQRRALMSTQNTAKKRKLDLLDDDSDENDENGELVSMESIEMIHKKRAHDKASRLATVLAGREDRGKYTHGHVKMNPNASTTNKAKLKHKSFGMIKHKVRHRQTKLSFREKQCNLKERLLRSIKAKK